MPLVLEVISDHKTAMSNGAEFSFGPEGGTIGRSLKNDWVLPDSDLYVSGRHASIDFRAGRFYLADHSSNGVYVNHSGKRLGDGNPHRLFDGDHIRMGSFEFLARVDEGQEIDVPAESDPSVVPDQVNALFPEDDIGSSVMLLDEDEINGDNALEALLDDDLGSSRVASLDSADSVANARSSGPVGTESVRRVRQASGDDDLLTRFLIAAGIDPESVDPDTDPAAVLTNAGEVLNELVGGITELMVARANMKSMFRLEQTGVMPQLNNPIKLSASTSDTIRQLLLGQEGEFLGPLASVREACKDLRWHHDGVIGAMIKAFNEYVERFDPDQVEEHFEETYQKKPFFSFQAKQKFWDHYRDTYPVLTQAGNASLPQTFSEDFVRQYDRQLADFSRVEGALGETQTIRIPESAHTDAPDDSAMEDSLSDDSTVNDSNDPVFESEDQSSEAMFADDDMTIEAIPEDDDSFADTIIDENGDFAETIVDSRIGPL